MKGFPAVTTAPPRCLSENLDPGRRTSCCPQCLQKYEQDLATLLPKEFEKSSSEVKSEAARPALPQWLQNAKADDSDAKATDQTKVNSAPIDSQTQNKPNLPLTLFVFSFWVIKDLIAFE